MNTQVVIDDIFTSLRKINTNTMRGEQYANEKVKKIPDNILLSFWKNAKNPSVKEQFEVLIAKKLVSYNPILQYNDVPRIYYEYLDLVSSLDAIKELLDSFNEKIYTIAYDKYCMFFEEFMDEDIKLKEMWRIK